MSNYIDGLVEKIAKAAPPRSNGRYDTGGVNNAIALIIQGKTKSMPPLTWRNLRYFSAWVAFKKAEEFRPESSLMLMVGRDWLKDYGPEDRPLNDPPPVDRYNTIDASDLECLVTVAAWQKNAGLCRIPSTNWPSAYKKITSWVKRVDNDPPAEIGSQPVPPREFLPWFDDRLDYSEGTKVSAYFFAKTLGRTFPTMKISGRSISKAFPGIKAFSVDHYVTACRVISGTEDPPPMSQAGARLIAELEKRGVVSL